MRRSKSGGGGRKGVLIGVLAALLAWLLLLALAARLTERGTLPESVMPAAALLSCGLGSLLGGGLAVRGQRRRLTAALVCGGILAALLLAVGLLAGGEEGLGAGLPYSLLAAMAPAAVMGLGSGRKKRR